VLALAGIVLAVLGLGRLGSGTDAHPAAGRRAVRVVAVRAVAAGARITAGDLGTVKIPVTWASLHQLADPSAAVGRRAAVALVAGAPVMDAEVAPASPPPAARELALRLDDVAGIPGGDLADVRGDVYVTPPGRGGRTRLVLANVLVLSARQDDAGSVATVVLPPAAVPDAIAAEGEGSLRLVVRGGGGAG
jgi:Flp pilus assembly protein CpaB